MKKQLLSIVGMALLASSTLAQQFANEREASNYFQAQDPENYEQLLREHYAPNEGVAPASSGIICTYKAYDQTDGIVWGYVDITSTGTEEIATTLDGATTVQLDYPITLYGIPDTEIEVVTSGFLSTGTGSVFDYTNDCPLPQTPSEGSGSRVYPYHDDLTTAVYYQYFPVSPYPHPSGVSVGAAVFQWVGINNVSGLDVDFQCVFYNTGDILYLYNVELDGGASATIGIQNDAVTLGTTYACNTPGSITAGVTAVFLTENLYVNIGADQTACTGLDVTFDATTIIGTPTDYTWSTGGSLATETFTAASTETVTVTVLDVNGCTGIASAELTVTDCYCDDLQGTAGFPTDPTCETAVCTIDSYCCSTQWDGICASIAALNEDCSSCWSPPLVFCGDPQGTAGFPSDPTCETEVCIQDSYCCNTEWDAVCASLAAMTPECAACLTCEAEAGTLTAGTTPTCLSGGTATVSASHNSDQVLPTSNFVENYVLVQAGLIVEVYDVLALGTGSPNFEVNAAGDYTIHTIVFQPSAFDFGLLDVGEPLSAIDDWFNPTIGDYCGAVDMVGATITVQSCPLPDNDLCTNADPLFCGITTTGATHSATSTGSPSSCFAESTDLGVWYTFTGTGGNVKLSTCGATTSGSANQPWFAVYTGDCNSLGCLGFSSNNDPDCGSALSVYYEFLTDAGVVYSVFVTSVSGAPSTVDFDLTLTCDPTVGISENAIDDINIYPNPSNGQFIVEVADAEGDAQIVVLDASGRKVYTEGVIMNGTFRKDLNLNVASGTYLLQIITEKEMVTRKIQIN